MDIVTLTTRSAEEATAIQKNKMNGSNLSELASSYNLLSNQYF